MPLVDPNRYYSFNISKSYKEIHDVSNINNYEVTKKKRKDTSFSYLTFLTSSSRRQIINEELLEFQQEVC